MRAEPRGTEESSMKKLTKVQISALLTGLDTKLDRSALGWGYEDEEGTWRVYYPVTIEALCKRGLLDSNFTDQRVHQRHGGGCTEPQPQNLDGARHAHSPEHPKFQVWTNERGREALQAERLLEA
jgi:hypothetical protein